MRGKHLISAGILWVALTAIGELLVVADLYPTVGSAEAEDFDRIFKFLLLAGIPVFAFVVATVIYSMIAFRSETGEEEGPPIKGTGWGPRIWIMVTGSLAAFIMVYPGMTGLAELQGNKSDHGWGKGTPEMVIQTQAAQFNWSFTYPDGTKVDIVKGKELVLPVDTKIRFEINSVDVVHSMWIPAFRMKIDAIPGRMTFMTVEPDKVGEYGSDQAYRVQCAELCGLDHAVMNYPVRVVEKAEFEEWLAGLNGGKQ